MIYRMCPHLYSIKSRLTIGRRLPTGPTPARLGRSLTVAALSGGSKASILRQEFADAGPLRHHPRDAQIHTFERLRQVARGAIVLGYQRVEIIAQLFSRFGIAEISAHIRQAGAEAETENARVALHELVEVRIHKLEGQLARGRGTLSTEQQQESVNQFHSAGEHLLHSGLNRGGVAEIGHGAEQAALILPILRLFELGQKTLE